MKKRLMFVLFLLLSLLTFGCSCSQSKFSVEVLKLDGTALVEEKELKLVKDLDLVAVLKADEDIRLDGSDGEYGFYITKAGGYEANASENEFWQLSVNGKQSDVGISALEVKAKDKITLQVTQWFDSLHVVIKDLEGTKLLDKTIEYLGYKESILDALLNDSEVGLEGSTGEYGFFITKVKGIEANSAQNEYWQILVDGVPSSVGISSLELAYGQTLSLELSQWQDLFSVVVKDLEGNELLNKSINYLAYKESVLDALLADSEVELAGSNSEYGYFITGVKGIEANGAQNEYWQILIDGEAASVGISSIELTYGQVLTFQLAQWYDSFSLIVKNLAEEELFNDSINYLAYKESVLDALKNHEQVKLVTEIDGDKEAIISVCDCNLAANTVWYVYKNGEVYRDDLNALTTSYGDTIEIKLLAIE
ncbi:MAG TPA: DUF4430 domain-containing protein [Bacilli bacterium]|jgi:hypothetical protein|nr:DUF4430 domain-containing protein [Bacilli bacterium]HOC97774.1 DUF4430 domain-containing protein [Bacilli bacterium]